MNDQSKKTVVNSWNEWDPLKHVIVGRPDNTMIQAPEPAVERDFPEDGFPLGKYGPIPQEMVEKAKEQMDHFVKILEKRGIRVDRPTPLNFISGSKPLTGSRKRCSDVCRRETCC